MNGGCSESAFFGCPVFLALRTQLFPSTTASRPWGGGYGGDLRRLQIEGIGQNASFPDHALWMEEVPQLSSDRVSASPASCCVPLFRFQRTSSVRRRKPKPLAPPLSSSTRSGAGLQKKNELFVGKSEAAHVPLGEITCWAPPPATERNGSRRVPRRFQDAHVPSIPAVQVWSRRLLGRRVVAFGEHSAFVMVGLRWALDKDDTVLSEKLSSQVAGQRSPEEIHNRPFRGRSIPRAVPGAAFLGVSPGQHSSGCPRGSIPRGVPGAAFLG
eukprot:gene9528-biopygen12230